MAIARNIPEEEKKEITDHLSLTAWTMVKAYTLRQLSLLDGVDTRTIRNSWKYIPVRIDYRYNKYNYIRWNYKKPYAIKRIRVDEIKYIFKKRNRGRKVLDEKLV